jgi:type I restriction enzyme S subunit
MKDSRITAAENTNNKTRILPEGWQQVQLGDVCEFLDSQRIPVNDAERAQRIRGRKPEELYPYYGANGQVGWIDDFIFDEPLILLAEDGGAFGSTTEPISYAVAGKCWVNNHAHVLRPKACIDFDFCLWSLRIRPDLEDIVSGSTRAKLNQRLARSISIPLPPLAEQKRISGILNDQMKAVERARAGTEAQLEAAKALPSVYLRTVFDSPEAERWPKKRLGEVCKIAMGQSPPGNSYNSAGQGVPLLNGPTEFGPLYPEPVQWTTCPMRFAEPGDILLCVRGATTGRKNVANSRYCIGRGLAALKGKEGKMDTDFLFHALDWITKLLLDRTSGSTFPNLPGEKLKDVELYVPSISEQRRISRLVAEKIRTVEQAHQLLRRQSEDIENLSSAILRKTFSEGL